MFSFPEQYGGTQFGTPLNEEHLREVTEASGLLDFVQHEIDLRVRSKCERFLPNPGEVEANNKSRKNGRAVQLVTEQDAPAKKKARSAQALKHDC